MTRSKIFYENALTPGRFKRRLYWVKCTRCEEFHLTIHKRARFCWNCNKHRFDADREDEMNEILSGLKLLEPQYRYCGKNKGQINAGCLLCGRIIEVIRNRKYDLCFNCQRRVFRLTKAMKENAKEYGKKYRQEHLEEIKAKEKIHNQLPEVKERHRVQERERQRRVRKEELKHPSKYKKQIEARKIRACKHYHNNHEKCLAVGLKYYYSHRAECLARQIEYKKKPGVMEKRRLWQRKYRAKKRFEAKQKQWLASESARKVI